jgi:hypothetical protein
LDGVNFGSALVMTPYSWSWDTTKVPNGCHTLIVTAQDSNGSAGTASISAFVSNQ